MFRGFDLLSDRMQQLFMATLAASERLHYGDNTRNEDEHRCNELKCDMMPTPRTDVYVCNQTGRVHECGALCSFNPVSVPDSNTTVCPLTGYVRTVQAKYVATGAFTSEHDSSAGSSAGLRKRKASASTAWAERDEKTGQLTGNRVFWIGKRSVSARRAPSLITISGEAEVRGACDRIVKSLYESDTSQRIMERTAPPMLDSKAIDNYHTACQYARLLCVYSKPYLNFHDQLDSTALCLVVLYTWVTGRGITMPPAVVFRVADTQCLSDHLPPRPELVRFAVDGGHAVSNDLFTKTDKFLQEVVAYWNQFAKTATRSDLSVWVPKPVLAIVKNRLGLR